MLTRIVALVLAACLGLFAWMTVRAQQNARMTADAWDKDASARVLTSIEARWRLHMNEEIDDVAALDFSVAFADPLYTIIDEDATAEEKVEARASFRPALVEALAASGADSLVLTDGFGVVLARTRDEATGDSIAAYPPVANARRGVFSDDLWVLDDKLVHVVGIPVLDIGEVVGTVLWRRVIRKQDLEKALVSLDVKAALYFQHFDSPISVPLSTLEESKAKFVAGVLESVQTTIAAARASGAPSSPFGTELGDDPVYAVVAPLPGVAGRASGAGIIVFRAEAPRVVPGDTDWTDSTTLFLFGIVVLGLLLALVFPIIDGRRADTPPVGFSARPADLVPASPAARPVERAPVRPERLGGSPDGSQPLSPDSLGSRPSPGVAPLGQAKFPGSMVGAPPPGWKLEGDSAKRVDTVPPPPPTFGEQPPAASAPGPKTVEDAPPPLPTVTPDDGGWVTPIANQSGGIASLGEPMPTPASGPVQTDSLPKPPSATSGTPDPFGANTLLERSPPSPEPEVAGDRTVISHVSAVMAAAQAEEAARGAGPTPEAALSAAREVDRDAIARREEEMHFREIYQQFLATKQRCGEPLDLPWERFVERLEATKGSLIDRYGCRTVRFTVYIKAGKAALKATPLK